MELRDKHCLYQIKDKFGGSVKLRAGDNHLRYRLHHKAGLLKLIDCVVRRLTMFLPVTRDSD